MLSAVIAAPIEGMTPDEAAAEITRKTGLRAYVNRGFGEDPNDFNTSTVWWYVQEHRHPDFLRHHRGHRLHRRHRHRLPDVLRLRVGQPQAPRRAQGDGHDKLPPQRDARHPVRHRRRSSASASGCSPTAAFAYAAIEKRATARSSCRGRSRWSAFAVIQAHLHARRPDWASSASAFTNPPWSSVPESCRSANFSPYNDSISASIACKWPDV